ncbi:MAG: thioredoxin family protein [Planctomycetia bacterium]|nr:thioredoxin family protein [Planctomycetia bacterium]
MNHAAILVMLLAGLPTVQTNQTNQKNNQPFINVNLTPGEPGSPDAPRYSPAGRQLKLAAKPHPELPGKDHLEARLPLGTDAKNAGALLVVARSQPGKPYDLLYVENQQTKRLNSMPITIKPNVNRNKHWSSFNAVVQVNHARAGTPPAYTSYPLALWIVVDQESDQPDIIRISRRGFLTGEVVLQNLKWQVVLSDSNNDGILGKADWWELRRPGNNGGMDASRTVGDYCWADGKAWRIELQGTDGRFARLIHFDPGITQAEDANKRDRLREDRQAARAARPVEFHKDIETALQKAKQSKQPYFIKFETDWCMPCKQMDQLVFTAKDVADAAQGIACVKADGDVRKDLTARHQVKAYPTGILFGADGKELARYVGYQGVKDMTAFFKKVE